MSGVAPAGHLFVVRGDLTHLACDAVLVPTDAYLSITAAWRPWLEKLAESAGWDPFDRPLGWGTTTRVQHRGTVEKGPSIWFGDVGGVASTPVQWFVDGAREFVATAAAAEHQRRQRDQGSEGRALPLLALPVVGSGQGGLADDKGALFGALVPALSRAAAEHRVDIALLCRDPKSHAAAQRVRRRLVAERAEGAPTWDELSPVEAQLGALAGHLVNRRLVVFIGSGVSVGAGLPNWNELLSELLEDTLPDRAMLPERLEELKELDARDQAALLARRLGDRYKPMLTERLSTERHALAHGLLAGLAVGEVVTTNYDQLFEDAVRGAGGRLAVLPREPLAERDRWLLKLHGDLADPDSIVLTRQDYLGLPDQHGALFGIVQALLITRHMLFLGYSLADDSFHRVVHEVRKARRSAAESPGASDPFGTVLLMNDDPLFRELWSDDLHVVEMGDRSLPRSTVARRVELFLDRLAFLAGDVAAFLLDDSYANLLDGDERALRDALRRVQEVVDQHEGPIHQRVSALLDELTGRDTNTGGQALG